MKFRFALAAPIVIGAALALAACDRGDDGPVTLDGLNANQEKPYSGPMPTDPGGWSTMLATNDAYQVEAAKLALGASRDAAVQRYAAAMQQFHTQASTDLAAIAATAKVAYQPSLSAYQQQQLGRLRSAGAGFDNEFKIQMIEAQQEAIWLLQGFAANGTSPELKAFAARNSPAVEAHLAQAYALPGPNTRAE
jgi:putative membrane protein